MDRHGGGLDLAQEMFGMCEAKNGTEINELLQGPEQVGTKEHGKMLKRIQILEDCRVPAKEAQKWEN